MQPVLRAHKVPKEPLAHRAQQVLEGCKASKAYRAQLVLRALQVRRVQQALKVHKALKEQPEPTGHKALPVLKVLKV